MALLDQRHTVRLPVPDLLVRGQANTISAPIYLDGALVAPTASGSTVFVYDGSGTAIVDGAAVTVSGSIASYTISAATLPSTLSLSDAWRVEWSLVLSAAVAPDGVILARNDAQLIRHGLHPVVTDADLVRRVSSLDTTSSTVIHSLSNLQSYVDEAWTTITLRLIEAGNRPALIMSPSSLREAHLCLALALVFDDLATRLSEAYETRARAYRDQYEAAWTRLRFAYDRDDDGRADTGGRRSPVSTLWLGGR